MTLAALPRSVPRRLRAGLAAVALAATALAGGCASDLPAAEVEALYAGPASQFLLLPDGVRLHLRDEGRRDAPVVVLLHGSNASLHTWEPWVRALSDRYRIVSLDFPAHGLTGPSPSGDYSTEAYTQVVEEVAVRLGLDRFVLGGNSMGGAVAWRYALAHPARVRGLILVDAAGYPREGGRPPLVFQLARAPVVGELFSRAVTRGMLASNLREVIADDSLVTDEMVDRYYALLLRQGNRAATLARLRGMGGGADLHAAIPTITAPTLVLWGDQDPWIPLADGERFAREIAGARLIVYPGVGHLPQEEVAAQSAADVGAFLATLPAPGP